MRNDPHNGGLTWRGRVFDERDRHATQRLSVGLDGQLKFQLRPNINEFYTEAGCFWFGFLLLATECSYES